MKHILSGTLVAAAALLTMSSCVSKTFLVTSGNENLTTLTKITDSQTSTCYSVGGDAGSSEIVIALSNNNEPNYHIYKKDNPLSPSSIQLTSGNNSSNFTPTYSVASDRIAFSRRTSNGSGNWSTADIYMVPATKGVALIPITQTNDANEFRPSFSSDGTMIAYQKTKGGSNDIDSEIWLKNLKTGETMLLGNGCSPKISPDGKRIAYTKFNNMTESHIWIMNIDGTGAAQISSGEKEFARNPSWSPDGSKIIFQNVISNKKKDWDLYIINSDGSGLMQITNNESEDIEPYWSSDNFIYFVSDRGGKRGNNQLWRFKYAGF